MHLCGLCEEAVGSEANWLLKGAMSGTEDRGELWSMYCSPHDLLVNFSPMELICLCTEAEKVRDISPQS